MNLKASIVCLALVTGVAAASFQQQPPRKGGEEETGPYDVVRGWPKPLHTDFSWGRTASIWAESPDCVFVLQSGELPVIDKPIPVTGVPHRAAAFAQDHRREHMLMVFDREGKLVESWEQINKLLSFPHSVVISPYDPERHVWIVDNGNHQIFKLTRNGQLVMTLGEAKVAASDTTHFGGPSDLEFLPNGDFLVSDGYRNTRIVKYSKDGKYLMEWGKPGKGPGEFNLPHSVAIDAKQRVYVADRGNSRIQVFDLNGKFLDEWPDIRFPLYLAVSRDQHVWVSDGLTQKILKYDLNGTLLFSWGTFGGEPGQLWATHGFSVDSDGNFYTAEVYGGRAQKFSPRKGVDPDHLVGALYGNAR